MPRFLIRREIPGVGQMSDEQLHAIAQKSNTVLDDLRGRDIRIQWDHSYVNDDTLHCVYVADNADAVREHARCGGFPCNDIMPVREMISPTTGDA